MVGVAFASGLALAAHRWTLAAGFAGAAAALLANGLFLNGDISLAWSPDGSRIAITGTSGIYVLPVSPRGAAQLAIPIPGAADLSYSPDGTQIAFDAPVPSTGTQTAIMIANSDGTDPRVLSTVPLTESDFPAWQPNP